MNDLIRELSSKLPADHVYPKGVLEPIVPRMMGRSFFPGGCGMALGASKPLQHRPIMLVGQDFGTLEYWEKAGSGNETKQGTWSGVDKLLANAKIDQSSCFFTNVLLGVRVSGPIDGPSPGLEYADYAQACLEYFSWQLQVVKPSVVVALGKVPACLLARLLFPERAVPMPTPSTMPTWNDVDLLEIQFVSPMRHVDNPVMAFATSVHPDRHWLHIPHRRWQSESLVGLDAHSRIWERISQFARACWHHD